MPKATKHFATSSLIFVCAFLLFSLGATAQVSSNMTLLGRWAEGPCFDADGLVFDIAIQDSLAFLANGNGGFEIIDVSDPIRA